MHETTILFCWLVKSENSWKIPAVAGLLIGLATGGMHATLLWRASTHASAGARWLGVLRLWTVGSVLIAAAFLGHIFPVAIGWACAFSATSGGLIVWRSHASRVRISTRSLLWRARMRPNR